jgi:hypothetical protein
MRALNHVQRSRKEEDKEKEFEEARSKGGPDGGRRIAKQVALE